MHGKSISRRENQRIIRRRKSEKRREVLGKIKEQGGPNSKLFWSDWKFEKYARGKLVEKTEHILVEMASYWEELGKQRGERNGRRDYQESPSSDLDDVGYELCHF